jgi:hypothetical protein
MPVRIPKINALAAQLPRAPLFYDNSVLRQPGLPTRQLLSRNSKCDMKLAIAIVRRLNGARAALFE